MRPLALALGLVAGAGAALLGLRRLDAVEVTGASMAPALLPRDRLLVESLTYARRRPRPGEVVLAADPRQQDREIIKRVATVDAERVELRGDHPAASTDSRTFGSLRVEAIRWRVALRYWPPLRFGGIGSAVGSGEPWARPDEGGEPACTTFGDLVSTVD